VVAKVRERLAENKQRSQKFDMERFNFNKLSDVEGKEQFRVEISNRFAVWKIWTQRWKLIVQQDVLKNGNKSHVADVAWRNPPYFEGGFSDTGLGAVHALNLGLVRKYKRRVYLSTVHTALLI
jgi:hypothetical protein